MSQNNNNENTNQHQMRNSNVISFMGCLIANIVSSNNESAPGPLVDDVSSFSAIDMIELRLISHIDRPSWIKIDPIQTDLSN